MDQLLPREQREIAPGAVHVPDFLTLADQRDLVARCREWAHAPTPMAAPVLPSGGRMSVKIVCLGWRWVPYRYTREGAAPFPDEILGALGRRALGDPRYRPDAALINFYDEHARMGMHRDREERCDAPVVSLSIGDSAIFRFGNPETRGRPYTDVELCSGDLFVFGGPSRYAYHGVPRILPGTGDPATGLRGGRLNITLRVTGL
ncbi:MAG TPA: alpha-ketoglutarate-dependent dioxygenase AlkB [Solirubrobacteraceae bacterium]|nr:alpha-ketoglutarate-dependent dioxygenase AlkB [Solirubrobacteraceae bacterium]